MTNITRSQTITILRWPEVHRRIGICRSYAHHLASQVDSKGKPKFPRPIKLGLRASGWLESEISDWIDQRIKASRSGEG
ncbi:MAG: AlpA family phage regulatory protein [Flavobacteriales bacterium]|nr:AlpA family phage regulatory protein [Flavobacteriales bacterium]